jgi:hypothetical protein
MLAVVVALPLLIFICSCSFDIYLGKQLLVMRQWFMLCSRFLVLVLIFAFVLALAMLGIVAGIVIWFLAC